MATVTELFDDRNEVLSAESPRTEIHYVVTEAVDEDDVKASVLAAVPPIVNGLPKITVTLDERINLDTWKVIVTWELGEELEEGESSFSFDTSGGSEHISQSLTTVGLFGPKASNLLGGAIGYDGENIQGVDIVVPRYSFSETHILPPTTSIKKKVKTKKDL